MPGTRLDRFGAGGRYFAPEGAPFGGRALPIENASAGYYQYEVLRSLPVTMSRAETAFGGSGIGIQYQTQENAEALVRSGHLARVRGSTDE